MMPSTTSQNRLEPVSPHNTVLLLVDQQEGLLSRVHEPDQTRATCSRWPAVPSSSGSR